MAEREEESHAQAFCHGCNGVVQVRVQRSDEPECTQCNGNFIEFIDDTHTSGDDRRSFESDAPGATFTFSAPDPGNDPSDAFTRLLQQYTNALVHSAQREQPQHNQQSVYSAHSHSSNSDSSQADAEHAHQHAQSHGQGPGQHSTDRSSSGSTGSHSGFPGLLQLLLSQHLSSSMQDALGVIQGGMPVNLGDYILSDADLNRVAAELGQQNPGPSSMQPTSQEAIDNLEHVTLGKNTLKESDLASCPVCSEAFADAETGTSAKRLPCQHLYHDSCILPWLERANTCPYCRSKLPAAENTEE